MPLVDTFRTRPFPVSAMYMFPAASTAIPEGAERLAPVASAPSPSAQHAAPPATVVMIPVVETLRIAFPSTTYMFPAESKVNPSGVREAEVACPPSPFPVDGFPPPATVLMVKLCPMQTPRNKKRPQAVFVISIRHSTISAKTAEHHYREECFSSLPFARVCFLCQRRTCFRRHQRR